MGTRGLFGFRLKEKDYLAYNHFDSYPSGLGVKMAEFVQGIKNVKTTMAKVAKLLLVSEDEKPSYEQIQKLRKFSDPKVSTGQLDEWYCLLRKCQGNPQAILQAGVMIDGHEFAADSLFCEWGYIVNFDTQKLEVYKGFQDKPHKNGRYARLPVEKDSKYYPIALVAEIPFKKVTPDSVMATENELVNTN